ncbi:heme-binding domain-containing protein [Paenimyroides tangerinum]|uniref:heme-binding domain-containing protein n=1 Tax=Paenimyroides tangerinum TaxID=2488728 RepID=UPI001F25113A|nr:heme-binding domain-containing protein [Paenimyroides tangerinum]
MLVLVIIQFFGIEKNNNPIASKNAIEEHYSVPPKIQQLLKTSCYDCHSNNTTYPWYSNVQPVKWWLDDHIRDGKKHLNFDEFNTYTIKKKLHKLDEVVETINKDEMPLTSYTLIHDNAKLSATDKKEVEAWVNELKKEIR